MVGDGECALRQEATASATPVRDRGQRPRSQAPTGTTGEDRESRHDGKYSNQWCFQGTATLGEIGQARLPERIFSIANLGLAAFYIEWLKCRCRRQLNRLSTSDLRFDRRRRPATEPLGG